MTARDIATTYGYKNLTTIDLIKLAFPRIKNIENPDEIKKNPRFKMMQELVSRFNHNISKDQSITQSYQSYDAFKIYFEHLQQEKFGCMYLNRSNKILDICILFAGSISHTITDVKIILGKAIELKASSIIIAHNHPSGNLKPSPTDETLTSNIKNACKIFDISLLDHLIITDHGYYSFNDEGKMY